MIGLVSYTSFIVLSLPFIIIMYVKGVFEINIPKSSYSGLEL